MSFGEVFLRPIIFVFLFSSGFRLCPVGDHELPLHFPHSKSEETIRADFTKTWRDLHRCGKQHL